MKRLTYRLGGWTEAEPYAEHVEPNPAWVSSKELDVLYGQLVIHRAGIDLARGPSQPVFHLFISRKAARYIVRTTQWHQARRRRLKPIARRRRRELKKRRLVGGRMRKSRSPVRASGGVERVRP